MLDRKIRNMLEAQDEKALPTIACDLISLTGEEKSASAT